MSATQQFCDNVQIFWALLCRDIHMLKHRLRDLLIDGGVVTLTQMLIFGKFFPTHGHEFTPYCSGICRRLRIFISTQALPWP